MKKLINRILIIVIIQIGLLIKASSLFSQEPPLALIGDLGVPGWPGYDIQVKFETYSIPFEGCTNVKPGYVIFNRLDSIQNGSIWRFFKNQNEKVQYNLDYIFGEDNTGGNILDLGHCSGYEFPDDMDGTWGFVKYKITLSVQQTGETYIFYFNCQDSKYGKLLANDERYSADWYFRYSPVLPLNKRLMIQYEKHGQNIVSVDTIATYDNPKKEFKVWEVLLNSQIPLERKFTARTTPFPINPNTIKNHQLKNFILGTTVVMDTVFYNFGEPDRRGYNTVIDSPYFYYSNPQIPGENILGETFVTPAFFYNAYITMKLTAESGDTLILKRRKRLWINGITEYNNYGDTIIFKPGSCLIKEDSAKIFTSNYGVLIDSGCNSVWNNYTSYRAFQKSSINFAGTNHIVNNGGSITIDGYAYLRLGDNTTLTFDGSNSYLKLKPNAQVELGSNAKIEFKDGAYINANNLTFSGIGSSPWEGLYFENAGSQTTITNCTLNTAKNPIKIVNNNTTAMSYNKVIKNNTFNLHQNGSHCIYAENVFDINIDGNTFNVPPYDGILRTGTYIKNYNNTSSNYYINIVNNTYTGGYISLILHSLTSNLTPVYVNNNSFNSAGLADLIGIKISGDIKNNSFSASSLNRNLAFSMSNAYLYKNIMYAGNINMNLAGNSTVHLAPSTYNQDNLAWSAGQNKFTSQNYDNIHIGGIGNIYTNFGNNHFTCTTDKYHLFGNLNTTSVTLDAWNNCWYYPGNNVAHGFLLNNSYQQITIKDFTTPNFQCPQNSPTQTDLIITDKGYDIYDTVVVTEGYPGPTLPEDERIYNLAVQKMDAGLYLDAIAAYKYYIDSYTESQFLNTSLYELYECHEMLDTCDDQNYRNILYGDLRMYLDGRIQSGLYDGEFVDIAYNLILMCEGNTENLDIALGGYEFLALFHPDPEARILASWDWDAVLDLLDSGSSGGISEKIIAKDKQRRIKKFEKLIDSDPLMKKLHDTYKIEENKRRQNTEKVIKSRTRDDRLANEKILRAKDRDQKLKTRASTNLTILRHLSKEEKDKRVLEDITLIYGNKYGENDNGSTNKIIPYNYSLSQNYPNPFNPTTTINYELPKDGTVKLIVYDMLGREVSKLVNNEFQVAGRYSVVFDGSSLSSGIYFYRIKAGSFKDVKRMIFIK